MTNELRLDLQLCFPLYAATHQLIKLYYPALTELGLTYPQYLVMLVLWENNGQMVTEIGRTLRLDTGTLTPLLKRLEALGFVERMRPTDDKRRVVILLTKKGTELKEKALHYPFNLGNWAYCHNPEVVHLREELYSLLAKMDETVTKLTAAEKA